MKKSKILKKLTTSFIVIAIFLTMLGASALPVFAYGSANNNFVGFSGDMTEEELESATNTIKNGDGPLLRLSALVLRR